MKKTGSKIIGVFAAIAEVVVLASSIVVTLSLIHSYILIIFSIHSAQTERAALIFQSKRTAVLPTVRKLW